MGLKYCSFKGFIVFNDAFHFEAFFFLHNMFSLFKSFPFLTHLVHTKSGAAAKVRQFPFILNETAVIVDVAGGDNRCRLLPPPEVEPGSTF